MANLEHRKVKESGPGTDLDRLRKADGATLASNGVLPILALIVLGLLPFLSILFSGQILFASDQIGSPAWKFYFDALGHGKIPWWNPYLLAGMPTFDAGFGDGAYLPSVLIGASVPIVKFITYNLVLHVLIAGQTSYFLLRRFFKLDRLPAVALAAAYMLNTNFISHIHAGHTAKFYIMAWLPLSLYFLLRSLQPGARWFHLLGLSLSIAWFISTSHLQFTYFVLMGYFIYWTFKSYQWIRARQYREALAGAGKFWLPILLGVGLAFPIFYPPIEYNQEFSVRGESAKQSYEHATSWSMHPEEAVSLIVPEFTGLNEKYWGRNAFKLNSEYPGLALLFLGVFGLAAFRKKWLWFWGAVGLMALIFSLGADTPLFHLFYSLVPGIKNFRAPSMMLFWLVTALMMMAAHAYCLLFNRAAPLQAEERARISKRLLQVGLGLSGFLLLAGMAASATYGMWNAVVDEASIANISQQAANAASFGGGAVKNALLLAVLVLATWKWALQTPQPGKFAGLLLAAVCLDLYLTNSSFIKGYEGDRFFPREPAVEFLKTEKQPFRVFGLPGALERGFMQYHEISTVDGFVDNESRIYRTFRAGPGGNYHENPNFMRGIIQSPDGSVSGNAFLDMLNVKYLAYRLPNEPGLRLAENRSVLPRTWFLNRWEVRDDNSILAAMQDTAFNPRKLAYVSATTPVPDVAPKADSAGTPGTAGTAVAATDIRETARDYNHLGLTVRSSGAGILALSEIWFPHWQVLVDGKPDHLLRINYALQGVRLTAGDHKVELRYASPWIRRSFMVSGLSLLLLAILAGGYDFAFRRRPGSDAPAA